MFRGAFVLCALLLLSLDARAFSSETYITLSGATYVVQGGAQTLTPLSYDPQTGEFVQETYT